MGILPLLLILLGLLMAVALGIPCQLSCRWRKPWGGSLVVWLEVRWLGWRYRLGRRGSRRQVTPKRVEGWIRLLQRPRVRRQILGILRRTRVQGWMEVGLWDPAQMGQWMGVLGALPPGLSSRICWRFDQQGWRSGGKAQVGIPVYRLLGILWGIWRYKSL